MSNHLRSAGLIFILALDFGCSRRPEQELSATPPVFMKRFGDACMQDSECPAPVPHCTGKVVGNICQNQQGEVFCAGEGDCAERLSLNLSCENSDFCRSQRNLAKPFCVPMVSLTLFCDERRPGFRCPYFKSCFQCQLGAGRETGCASSSCALVPPGGACKSDEECSRSARLCKRSVCTKGNLGDACLADQDCAEGIARCKDHVCSL